MPNIQNNDTNKSKNDSLLSIVDNTKDLNSIITLLTQPDEQDLQQTVKFRLSPRLIDILLGLNSEEASEVFKTILQRSYSEHLESNNKLLELLILQLRPVYSEKRISKNNKYPWSTMSIGDSFRLDKYSTKKQNLLNTVGNAWFARNKPHGKITTRKEGDDIVVSRIR